MLRCKACNKEIEPEVLKTHADGTIQWKDLCDKCWEEVRECLVSKDEDGVNIFNEWKSTNKKAKANEEEN